MAPNALGPAFVRIDYKTAYAPHVMLIPTKAWIPTSMGGTLGSYTTWAGGTVDSEAMINALLDKVKAFFLATTSFNLATIYTQSGPTAPSVPQASAALAQVGTNTGSTQAKATQTTLSLRTLGNGRMKLVWLDAPVAANFDKVFPSAFPSGLNDVVTELRDVLNAWSGRDNTQPGAPISMCYTMSEKLRKEYRMA